jgi:fluoride exporter
VARAIPSTLPYGTFIINFTASLLLGFFLVWISERVIVDPRWRIFVAIGFCGSYSTYSSFAFETFALFEKGHWLGAALNIAGTNVLCFAAVIIGAAVARAL